MSTYGTMIDRICDETDRSDLSLYVRAAIKTAIVHYESERFYFNEERAEMDTITAYEYYSLPADYQHLDTLIIDDNDSKSELIAKPWSYIEKQARSTFPGKPQYFCVYRGELRVNPIPDGVYNLEMGYVKKLDDLSATADTNSWMVDCERMIRCFAKAELYAHKIGGPESMEKAQMFKALAEEEHTQISRESARRTQLGLIVPWGVL